MSFKSKIYRVLIIDRRIVFIVALGLMISINGWAKPKAVVTNSGPICAGSDVTLREFGGDARSWKWSSNGSATFNNSTSQNPIASGAKDGEIFKVVIRDIRGDKDSATTTVKVITIPTPVVTVVNNCDGTSTLSTVSGGANTAGCLSSPSANVTINVQPQSPSAPDYINQLQKIVPTGPYYL